MTTAVESPAGEKADPPATGFQRRLGPFDATMLVAGSMIGSGIFIVSADIARDVGSAGGLLAVWLVTGLLTVCGALSYGELAGMMPRAGGQYVYLREAYSPLWGFLYGWTLFLVIQTGTIAAVGVAFAKFLGVLVPALGTGPDAVLYRVGGFHLHWTLPLPWLQEPLVVLDRTEFTVTGGQLVGAALVVFLTALNCRGVQEGKIVQNVFTVTKTLALALVIVLGFALAYDASAVRANLESLWSAPVTPRVVKVGFLTGAGPWLGWLMVAGGAMVGSLFSSDAWNNVTFAAGEVKNPRRTLPLALVCGTGLVTALYLLANVAYLTALPVNANAREAEHVAARLRSDLAASGEVNAEARLAAARAAALEAQAAEARMLGGEKGMASFLAGEAGRFRAQAEAKAEQAAGRRAEAVREADEQYARTPGRPDIAHAPDDRVGTAVMELAFPRYGAPIMAVAIMVSTFGCLNGLILAGARLYWAMARDGLFFRQTGTLNARGVPAAGLVLQAVWAVLLMFSGTYGQLLDYVIFAALLFYVATVSGLFVLRVRRPDAERPYRALGYPLLPLAYVVVSALIMLDLLIVRPEFTWPGLIIVLTGVPAYFLWRLFGRPAPASSVEA